MVDAVPPMQRPYPSKLFVEVTTACNLRCSMCVKQSGAGIQDEYLDHSTFHRLVPAFPTLETLVLNGIGEPLLHPLLEEFVRTARGYLPETSTVAFQTNGTLLTPERARSLLDAGTDVVCLSVDAEDPALFQSMREGGAAEDVNRAAEALNAARKTSASPRFRWGAELVLTRETLDELPRVVKWVSDRGGSFLLVTHLLPYSKESVQGVAYNPNVDETLAFYREKSREAQEKGLDLSRYIEARWRFRPVERRAEVVAFMEKVIAEISVRGLPQHVPNLVAHNEAEHRRMEELFQSCEELASRTGIELRLPSLGPRYKRRCDFIEEGSAFVSASGTVHPCYFLWHSFICHADGRVRPVDALSFGSVHDIPLLDIWNGPEFSAYRNEIGRYDFPHCGNCSLAPCDYIERHDFEQDCLGNLLTCGSCPWSVGVLQCLR